jgi:hypothetical protein
MSGTQLTMLIPKSALDAHAELLAALGTENNPAQWMYFMGAVTRRLPDVLSSGRPTKEAIQRSAIGQLGFTSWQAMIEAPVDASGLGWNFSGWKAWRRAWTVVQAYPWLRNQPLTSSEVNAIALDCKAQNVPFPQSMDDLQAMREAKAGAKAQAKADSLQGVTERAEKAEKGLADALAASNTLSARIALMEGQLATALGQVAEQAETIGTLRAEKSQVEQDRDGWKKRAQAQAKPAEPAQASPKGFWQRLWSLLRGK